MRTIHALCAVLVVFCGSARCLADAVLVRDGKPVARILVAPEFATDTGSSTPKKKTTGKTPVDGDAALRAAVQDLVYHLRVMSGATLEVGALDENEKPAGPAIVVGEPAVALGAKPVKTNPSREGFRILVRGELVLIGGETNAAAAHGVYELLRKLGCDWVMPGTIGEIIPRRATVALPELDLASAPDFQLRRLWYRGYRTQEHPAKAEEGARFAQWIARQQGGGDAGAVGQCAGHEWGPFISRHKDAFDKDPTMLALRPGPDGKLVRAGPQLEATHPRVAELFADDIIARYEANIASGAWTRDTAAGFPIGPSDGLGYSVSPEAIAASANVIDPITGDPDQTDVIVLLANRVLEKVHAKFPNAHVGFYSYSVHAGYPVRYKPDAKLGQIFAPINYSRYHSVLDANSRTQPIYRAVVEKWGELSRAQGNPLMYRGYNWNLAENLLPYTKARIWGEEIPFYKKQNMLGMNVEATKMWSILGPSDYMFMRLCWDASRDWRAVLREYCERAYGKGAAAMEEYHLALANRQSEAKQEAGSYHATHLIFDDKWVADAAATIARAAGAADNDADRARIAFSADAVESLRLYLAYHKASLAFDFPAAKAGLDAMRAHWRKQYDANSDLVANEAPGYLNRYLKKFVDEGVTFSAAPYRITHRLPDELPTAFDRDNTGFAKGCAKPDLDDSKWVRTRTISTTWDAQRLTDTHRADAAWYRFRFDAESSTFAPGQGLSLFLGGFEDEARVYLNNELIGSSGRRFSNPAQFDLTAPLRKGTNLLAIQIVRNSAANEIGLGGLLRPSFLFTGPRLATPAPVLPTGPEKQVLPGGEVD